MCVYNCIKSMHKYLHHFIISLIFASLKTMLPACLGLHFHRFVETLSRVVVSFINFLLTV